jgi:peroxiredoxin family protein
MKSKEKEFEKQELEEDMLEDGLKELMIKHVPSQSLADRLITQSNNHDQLRSTFFTCKLSLEMMGINEEEKKQPVP